MSSTPARRWRESGPSRRPPRPTARETVRAWVREGGPLALGLGLFVFAAHLAYGANNDRLSTGFTALTGAGFTALFFASAEARRALRAPDRRVAAACVLFAVSFGVALLGLTPWLPGGPHPVWTYVTAAPAVTVSRSDTVLSLIRLAGLGCAFLFGFAFARREERVAHLFSSLLVVFSVFAFWALWGFLSDPGGLFGYRREVATSRLMAAFGSPNSAALLFSIGLALAVVDLLRLLRRYEGFKGVMKRSERALPRLAPAAICALLCAAALTLTQSRVGAVAAIAALGALAAAEALRAQSRSGVSPGPSLFIAGGAGAALFLTLVAVRPEIIARLTTAGRDLEVRETIFAAHWRAILAAPWFGWGLGTFDTVNKLVATSQSYAAGWNIRALHDVYLEWIEGVGFVGALPMFGAVIAANLAVAEGAFRRERTAAWKRGILGVSLIVCVTGLTDYGLEEPSIALMWSLLLGVGAGMGRR